jgi:hypothetical protein
LTPERRAPRLPLSPRLPALGSSPPLRHPQRQARRRRVSARGMVQRTAADRGAGNRVWGSGPGSPGMGSPPVLPQRHLTGYATLVERLQPLGSAGDPDSQMAQTWRHEGWRAARRARVWARTVWQMRQPPHRVRRAHPPRCAAQSDDLWTSHGRARPLGVEREGCDQRLRTGTLREPEGLRQPPYGNDRSRDAAAWLARLRTAVHRRRRWGRGAAPGASAPARGVSLAHPVARESRTARRARTSRTHRIAQEATADASGGEDGPPAGTPPTTGARALWPETTSRRSAATCPAPNVGSRHGQRAPKPTIQDGPRGGAPSRGASRAKRRRRLSNACSRCTRRGCNAANTGVRRRFSRDAHRKGVRRCPRCARYSASCSAR